MRNELLLLAITFTTVTACARDAPLGRPAQDVQVVVEGEPGPMRPVVPTRMGGRLAAIGLDVKSLPPLERLDPARKRKLMKTFSDSLGVPCTGCHTPGDPKADTGRKRVAKRMYNEIVRSLALESGEPIYCDSCHQGSMFPLDRRDKAKVSDFMNDVLVGKLKRIDGRDHDCGSCHGDPPDFKFVTAWKSAPAPDADTTPPAPPAPPAPDVPAVVASGSATASSAPNSAPAAPRKPPPPSPPRVSLDCGDKNNLCPMQTWMRHNVASAVAANDTAALARALDRVATFSPDPAWSWAAMSRSAADAARRGDMAEARKSCQGCHNAYKSTWREKYRTRQVR